MPTTDFNGDGRDDLLLQRTGSLEVMNWLGQPNGGFAYNDYSEVDPWANGELVGIGDLNGDGRSDTLWLRANRELYRSETEEFGAFFFYFNTGFVATLPAEVRIAGTGDFDGDGDDDIVFQSGTQGVSIWLSTPNGFAQGGGYVLPGGWDVLGTGDFNGDGRDDVLLRNGNGTITNWLGDANGGFHSNHAVAVYPLGNDWHLAGTGDFNNDDRDDLLLRNDAGIITEWLATPNGGFASNHAVATYALPLTWQVSDVGDYNGNGYADLALRHDDGTVTTWLGGAGGALTSNHAVAGYALSPEWQVQPIQSYIDPWDY
jgi:FG-GAP-like repeat